jgi:hypothetical protein
MVPQTPMILGVYGATVLILLVFSRKLVMRAERIRRLEIVQMKNCEI